MRQNHRATLNRKRPAASLDEFCKSLRALDDSRPGSSASNVSSLGSYQLCSCTKNILRG
jgi:hypothetical protein